MIFFQRVDNSQLGFGKHTRKNTYVVYLVPQLVIVQGHELLAIDYLMSVPHVDLFCQRCCCSCMIARNYFYLNARLIKFLEDLFYIFFRRIIKGDQTGEAK